MRKHALFAKGSIIFKVCSLHAEDVRVRNEKKKISKVIILPYCTLISSRDTILNTKVPGVFLFLKKKITRKINGNNWNTLDYAALFLT